MSVNKPIIKYVHHQQEVYVYEQNKGKHREHCLCWDCKKFTPQNRGTNCRIANIIYNLNIKLGITTPVWECAYFEEMKK